MTLSKYLNLETTMYKVFHSFLEALTVLASSMQKEGQTKQNKTCRIIVSDRNCFTKMYPVTSKPNLTNPQTWLRSRRI
jgi:hypothetical protein